MKPRLALAQNGISCWAVFKAGPCVPLVSAVRGRVSTGSAPLRIRCTDANMPGCRRPSPFA